MLLRPCSPWSRVRRLPAVALVAFLLVAATPAADAAITSCSGSGGTFAGGSGTTADPYRIATAEQLDSLHNASYLACAFLQTADIELSGAWIPVGDGTEAATFSGSYDGGGHRIDDLRITSGAAFVGFFGYTWKGARIENLRLSGSVDVPDGYGVGALVGLADRPTQIANVHSSVDVRGQSLVGGLVGWLAESTITRSSASGAVVGSSNYVGGLVGMARSDVDDMPSAIDDSYAIGSVTGGVGFPGVAGLVGAVEVRPLTPYAVTITNSFAAGAVNGGAGSREECDEDEDPPECTTYDGTTGGIAAPFSASPGWSSPRYFVFGSFWDAESTGRATTADDKGTGLPSGRMRERATFAAAGWDITDGWSPSAVWGICDGASYPFLTAQYTASPCSSATPTESARTVTARPRVRVALSPLVDGVARVRISWRAAEPTAPAVLTTQLPPGARLATSRDRRACVTARGRVVTILVPGLAAGARGSCSFGVVVTRATFTLTVRGGAVTVVSRTVRSIASPSAWVRSAVAVLRTGTPREALNMTLDAYRSGGMTRAQARDAIRRQVLAVRRRQIAAAVAMPGAPPSLAQAEALLRRSLRVSANADRAYIAWLGGRPERLEQAVRLSLRATATKSRLLTALRGHGVLVPAGDDTWP